MTSKKLEHSSVQNTVINSNRKPRQKQYWILTSREPHRKDCLFLSCRFLNCTLTSTSVPCFPLRNVCSFLGYIFTPISISCFPLRKVGQFLSWIFTCSQCSLLSPQASLLLPKLHVSYLSCIFTPNQRFLLSPQEGLFVPRLHTCLCPSLLLMLHTYLVVCIL